MGCSAAKSVVRAEAATESVADRTGTPVAQSAFAGVPALVVAGDGSLKFSTAQSQPLLNGVRLKDVVRRHVDAALAESRAQLARVVIPDNGEDRRFDLTLVPSVDGDVLIIAKETSLEANLLTALQSSRELFRDLAACNVDFAFETDAGGAFSWVSPRGALGYSAAELHGTHPTTVFGEVAGVEAFSAPERVEDLEVWLHGKDGKSHCLIINAVVVVAHGKRRATRGVARDVTALRAHERQAWRAKRRDDLAAAIVEAMRAEIDPRKMLSITATALQKATKSDAVTIMCHGAKKLGAASGDTSEAGPKLQANAIYHGSYNGTITLVRRADRDSFGDDERHLLAAVMPQLGVAIALGESLVDRTVQTVAEGATC